MRCPDHPKELIPDQHGRPSCPFCKGALLSYEELGEAVASMLAVETREKSAAFTKTRHCPSCSSPMTPLRIGKMEAWLEKCPSCELHWAEKQDLNTIAAQSRQKLMRDTYESFSEEEKKEIARDIAAATAPPAGVDLSWFQMALALFGVPVVTRTTGNRLPVVTYVLAAVLIAVYFLGRADSDFGVDGFGYVSGDGVDAGLISANFAHFSFFHLFGNVAFLLAFGDGVEQRWPRWALPLMFVLGGAVSLYVEGSVSDEGVLIAGASGGVAVIMGACVVLQPQARVVFLLFKGAWIAKVPILWFGVFELGYQIFMGLLGVPGVAWWAHGSGLLLGALIGFGTRDVDVQRAPVALPKG